MDAAFPDLPPELKHVLPVARWEDMSGDSGARVWRSQRVVLKVQARGRLESLKTEQAKLRWLSGRLPCPVVLAYAEDATREYLVSARLSGLPMHHPDALLHALRNADLLARALRQLHALPIRECPFNQSLPLKLRQARERLHLGLIDETDFDIDNKRSAAQVMAELLRDRPAAEDLVVTHGDACLPNVLVSGEYVEGFIDVGRLGIADRHADVALAYRSTRCNAGEAAAERFLDVYGRELIEQRKIEYYTLLDELF